MKETIGICFCFGLLAGSIQAQGVDPVHWAFRCRKIADKTFEIHLTATVQNLWHLYSQNTPDGGPVATTVQFSKNPLLNLEGAVKEKGELIKKHEEVFGVDVLYYNDNVDFVQVVKLKLSTKTNISGIVKYMVCNDRECLPPKNVSFNLKLE